MGHLKFRRRYRTDHVIPSARARPAGADAGVVYLALGATHAQLAAISIASLRRVGYAGPIRVVTDVADDDWPASARDGVERIGLGDGVRQPARYYKTLIHRYGFGETLFLDTDILAIAPIDGIWSALAHADLALALELPRVQGFIDWYWEREPGIRAELTLMQAGFADRPFYNSGVIGFRRGDAIDRAFDAWHEEWRRYGGQDQCALVRALARTSIEPHTLPACWNCPPTKFATAADARAVGIRLLHFFRGEQRARLAAFAEEVSR